MLTMRILIIAVCLTLALSFTANIQAQEMSPEKTALYTKYYELKKGGEEGQKQAYEVAKEYLQKFGNDDDQYTQAVKKFVVAYEKLLREVPFYKAYSAKEYAKAFELGKPILNVDPENFVVLANMVRAAYFNAFNGNKSLNAEAVETAKKALALIDAGKVTTPEPFSSMDEAKGFLNYALGYFLYEKSPLEAETALLKAAAIGSTKSEPTTYYYLGNAILKGEYDPLSEEYKQKHAGKDETPEGKAMFEKLIAIGSRAVDSYARAVALSTKPENAKFKAQAMAELTEIYKGLHNNSDAGLNELIAGVLSKPLPQQ
jgi:hypothetical protein